MTRQKQHQELPTEVEYAPTPLGDLLKKPTKRKRAKRAAPKRKKAAKKPAKRRVLSQHERDMKARRRIWGKAVHKAAKQFDGPQDTLLIDDIAQRAEPVAAWMLKKIAKQAAWAAQQRLRNPGVDLATIENASDPACPKCGERHYRLTCEAAE